MIRMETNKKNIKIGEYYTKVNGIYIVGDGGDLELLKRLYAAEGYLRVIFEEKIGDKGDVIYHYFSFDMKLYKTYNSIQGLLEQFGDIVIFDLDDIQPNKKSVKKVAGFLDKKNIAVFGVLVVAVAGTILFLNKEKDEPIKPITPVIQQTASKPQPPPPPPTCHTNLPSFTKLFDYSDQVANGKVVKTVNDKTIEMALQSIEVAPVEKADVKIPSSMDENAFNMQDAGDRLIFNVNGYDNCLLFIDANKKLPLTIDTLNMGNCSIYLEKSCIKGG
ncbi:MAG: hypothetical protein JHC31_05440 [Sulfurihydrogenibium sp.]|nr:hypothetical protein [Sulfurihydrogenibium sp.]